MALLESNGGWPIIMESAGTNLTNFTWQEIDNVYNWLFGGSSFFKISYEADEEDSTRNILMVFFHLRERVCVADIQCPHISATIIRDIFRIKYVTKYLRIINSVTSLIFKFHAYVRAEVNE